MTEEYYDQSSQIVTRLCESEGKDVVLRFDGPMSSPASKYNGYSRRTEMLSKATINATIWRASIEDEGQTLICFAKIDMEELDRIGIDESVVYTETDEESKYCVVDINATRKWWLNEYEDLTREKAKEAIEKGKEKEVLPPWDGLPNVTVKIERTEECIEKSYKSGMHIQYSSPNHEIGELIDVRVK